MVSSAARVIASGATRAPPIVHSPRGSRCSWNTTRMRIEVVLGRHVEHGVVLVVEAPVLVGAVEVALDQVLVEVPVRAEVAERVHRHEARVLQEAGVDAAAAPRIALRHRVDQVGLEPAQGMAGWRTR